MVIREASMLESSRDLFSVMGHLWTARPRGVDRRHPFSQPLWLFPLQIAWRNFLPDSLRS